MPFVAPAYSRSEVNRAGDILGGRDPKATLRELRHADEVLTNWRASHAYPINTFQATLRSKLSAIDGGALVAQRLKRKPSIVAKLQRFQSMELSRMQDIGGLRAVVSSVARAQQLETLYRNARFKHRLVAPIRNYIDNPKSDGYRSIHLIYKYESPSAPQYNGLSVELQIRTKLQHAWATAVETMGTYLGQALKSGQGELAWREFFTQAGAALAAIEKTPPVPGFERMGSVEVFQKVAETEGKLRVLERLRGFAVATDKITTEGGKGDYHLVILNSSNRTVSIKPFAKTDLERANWEYSVVERRAADGDRVEAVLVSAGPVEALRKAYPNYFLDTQEFVRHIEKVMRLADQIG